MESENSASIQSANGGDDHQDLLDSSSSFFNPSSILTHQNPTFFDPPKHTNNLHHHHLIWSMGLTSQQNYYPSCGTSSSSPLDHDAHALGPEASLRPDHLLGVSKNPKKRSRASHRPTTTVLQTDLTNFRQMVQEFTGFPAASLPGTPYSRPPELLSAAVLPCSHLDTPGPIYTSRPLFPSQLNPTTTDAIVTTANLISTNHDSSGFQNDCQGRDEG